MFKNSNYVKPILDAIVGQLREDEKSKSIKTYIKA